MSNENVEVDATRKIDSLGIDIHEVMESVKDKVRNGLVESIAEAFKDSLSYRVRDELQSTVSTFFATEIKDEVEKMLLSKKADILLGVAASLAVFGDSLSKKMMESLVQKVGKLSDYDIRKIFEAIL